MIADEVKLGLACAFRGLCWGGVWDGCASTFFSERPRCTLHARSGDSCHQCKTRPVRTRNNTPTGPKAPTSFTHFECHTRSANTNLTQQLELTQNLAREAQGLHRDPRTAVGLSPLALLASRAASWLMLETRREDTLSSGKRGDLIATLDLIAGLPTRTGVGGVAPRMRFAVRVAAVVVVA